MMVFILNLRQESEEEPADGDALDDTPETVEMGAPKEPPVWERPFLQDLGGKLGTVMVDPVLEVFIPLKKGCPDYQITPSFVDGELRGYVVDSASRGYKVTPYWSHMLASSRRAQEASKNMDVQQQIAELKSQNPMMAVVPAVVHPGTPRTPRQARKRATPSPKTHPSPNTANIPGTGGKKEEEEESPEDQGARDEAPEAPQPTDVKGLEDDAAEVKDDDKEADAPEEARQWLGGGIPRYSLIGASRVGCLSWPLMSKDPASPSLPS